MSLSAITATARRALANPPAKRGMFALVERRRSSTAMHGATTRYTVYAPGIVTSVDRAGLAKEVRTVCRLADASGFATEYRTRDEAVAAIKAAAGLS